MVQFSRLWTGVAVFTGLVFANPLHKRFNYQVKETHNPPRKWSRIGPAPAGAVLNLHIGLKMGKWEELERHLYEVSDPFHKRYGQHLSAEEANALITPKEQSLNAVHDWLEAHGYTQEKIRHSPAKDWVRLTIPVGEAERLLNTKYSVYRHEDGTEVVRTPEWSLPRDLHQHVVAIQPTNSFLRAAPQKANYKPFLPDGVALTDAPEIPGIQKLYVNTDAETNTAAANPSVQDVCNTAAVTPACLRTLYKTIDYVPKATDKNVVGFTNYLNETAMMSDVNKFLQRYRPDAVGAKINYTLINNGENLQTLTAEKAAKQQNAEGNLDGETIIGFVHPTQVVAYNTGGSPPFEPDTFTKTNTNEPYLEWLEYMLADGRSLPQTISTSYGDDEQTVPRSYAELVCQKMGVLGSRGVTLLFASGDNGVGGEGACISNDGEETATFLPSFPDSCPFVTSVGGTKNFNPEVAAWHAANNFASGGGYSNYFARPDYQNKVVSAYTTGLGDLYETMYNASGRGYPDLAAQAQSYVVVWNGQNIQLDGTSASTPTMAGIIGLLNDHLIANGKSALGFMNPWLYSVGFQGFNDITNGSSKGCGGDGFPAKTGWDAVTGFGTPDFKKLQQLVIQPTAPTGVTE